MALLVTKSLSAIGGIDLSQIYIRFHIVLDFDGKKISVNTANFISKEAYLENNINNVIQISGIPKYLSFDYDRAVNGNDVLVYVHNKVKEYLSTDILTAIPILDPSSGEYQYDSSTGVLLTQQVVSVPKFTQDSSIALIDID